MSLKHRWISLVKAQCILLLCLQYVCITHCQEVKTSPSDPPVKDVGVTEASNVSPMDTSPTSVSGDSGQTGTDAVNQTSTGSLVSVPVDIEPSPSSSLFRDSPSVQSGETTLILPCPSSAVLLPLSTMLQSPEPLYSTMHEHFQESISSFLTDSVLVQERTELLLTDSVAIVTTGVSESMSYSEHMHLTSISNFESSASMSVPTASIPPTSSSSSSVTIPSTDPSVSNETSSSSVTFSTTSSNTSNSSSTSTPSPVVSSSRDTTLTGLVSSTPGKPVNTTKLPTNSSNTPGEEDRLHKRQDEGALNTPAIIGIGFGAAATALVIVGLIVLLLKRKAYRRNKSDSSNFWDDNVTLSYINSHAEFPKDFDAEMMSLDDDSFLNSLDSMTFANLWAADTAKHTNF